MMRPRIANGLPTVLLMLAPALTAGCASVDLDPTRRNLVSVGVGGAGDGEVSGQPADDIDALVLEGGVSIEATYARQLTAPRRRLGIHAGGMTQLVTGAGVRGSAITRPCEFGWIAAGPIVWFETNPRGLGVEAGAVLAQARRTGCSGDAREGRSVSATHGTFVIGAHLISRLTERWAWSISARWMPLTLDGLGRRTERRTSLSVAGAVVYVY